MLSKIKEMLGSEADSLLSYKAKFPKDQLNLPGPDFVDRVFAQTDRNINVLKNLQWIFQTGRLAGTGYVSILPVDQGIEHSAGASFAPNPVYFDPENIVKLAMEGGCNAVASTLGVLGMTARKYAHKIPYIVKINHNELLTYPNKFDQIMFANVEQVYDMVLLLLELPTILPDESARQIMKLASNFICTRTWYGYSFMVLFKKSCF
jgi:class I fructose-bisphosphate aldolase